MEVYKTKDYDKFKFLQRNRNTTKLHIRKLVDSISENNLLEIHPIIVNESFEILDGQHRLEACKILNEYIYYKIFHGTREEGLKAIFSLNGSQKTWHAHDYLKFCADDPKIKDLLEFKKDYPFGIKVLSREFFKPVDYCYQLRSLIKNLQFSDNLYENLNFLIWYDGILKSIPSEKNNIEKLRSTTCVKAFKFFYNSPLIDRNKFYEKLLQFWRSLPAGVNLQLFLESLKNIYNYRLRNPISITKSGRIFI